MKTVEVRHPLVQHKIGLLRQAALNTKDFRELVTELGTLLAYEATADLETEPATMDGWAGPVQVRRIAGAKITVVPILRAGLATGGTLIATIGMLKRAGARRIKGIFLVAAPEGLAALEAAHPDVEVYTAAIDQRLDARGYILPGLGDAGDRIFGTRL